MATTFKTFGSNDITSTRTLLHEAIPLTGTIVSGTYTSDGNIKNFSHGMFQSTYDYPYLSSSANHIFDITCGYSDNSSLSGTANRTEQEKKINIYNELAQVLVGHDATGSIKEFQIPNGDTIREAYFINFSRLLTKDEIKKGSFTMKLDKWIPRTWTQPISASQDTITTTTNSNNEVYYTDSPAGEYAILSSSMSGNVGLLYYQAGIAVIGTSSVKQLSANTTNEQAIAVLTGSAISASADALRHWWVDLDFNNTTELNSTIYFARANHNEFNYSANPTYLSSSQIRVKESTLDEPVSYVTTVGLYSADNELLAVAKLSEPLKKTPANEMTIRVRLDY